MTDKEILQEAVEFIQDYQNGKYGYSVRGEAKAFMYSQALKAKTDEQLHKVHYGFENALISIGNYNDDKISDNAWVSQKGQIYYCQLGNHLAVAEWCFLTLEKEFEKTHAKIKYNTFFKKEATQFLSEKPSNLMLRALKTMGVK